MSRTESSPEETLPDKRDKTTTNDYFAKIGKSIQDRLGVSFNFQLDNTPGFDFEEETPESVKKLIDRLKAKVATGYDRIPSRVIKDLSNVVCDDLAKLVNLSYRTKIFPSHLKHAIIRPSSKNKGSPNNPEFYRPISVLSVIRFLNDQPPIKLSSTSKQTVNSIQDNTHTVRNTPLPHVL